MAAVRRLREVRGVEPLRLARPPRQREDQRGPVQRLLDGLGLRAKRPPECTPQLLADRVGQPADAVEVGEDPIHARVGRGQHAHRLRVGLPDPSSRGGGAASAGGSSAVAGLTAPLRSRASASRSSTTRTRPAAARSAGPHR